MSTDQTLLFDTSAGEVFSPSKPFYCERHNLDHARLVCPACSLGTGPAVRRSVSDPGHITQAGPDSALARDEDPESSHDAADMASKRASKVNVKILDVLFDRPTGYTSEEIATVTGERLVTVSPRLKPLEKAGMVQRLGKDQRRANLSGVKCVVWTLTEGERRHHASSTVEAVTGRNAGEIAARLVAGTVKQAHHG